MGDRRVFNPPLPEDVSERQFGTAWLWSKRLGLPTSRDCLVNLARLVPPGFTGDRPQDKAWKYVLSQGRLPERRVVKAYTFFARAEERRHAQRAKAAALAAHLDFDRLGPEVAAWIGRYVQEAGTGPLWREVGAAFGWDRIQAHAIIEALHRAGWVSSSPETRSLRPAQPNPCPQHPRLPAQDPPQGSPESGSATWRVGCRLTPPSRRLQRTHGARSPGRRRF